MKKDREKKQMLKELEKAFMNLEYNLDDIYVPNAWKGSKEEWIDRIIEEFIKFDKEKK